jgi:hypothetical protein
MRRMEEVRDVGSEAQLLTRTCSGWRYKHCVGSRGPCSSCLQDAGLGRSVGEWELRADMSALGRRRESGGQRRGLRRAISVRVDMIRSAIYHFEVRSAHIRPSSDMDTLHAKHSSVL